MAQWYRVRVTIPHSSGLPEDEVVNTWSYMIGGSGDRDTLAADFQAQLDAFYTAWVPGYGHTDYGWGSMVAEHFDMLEERPRRPFQTLTFATGTAPASNSNWPAEVSITLSFQKTAVSGERQARMRGRVYLGPLSQGAADEPLIPTAIADAIAGHANTQFFGGTGLTHLAVYSPSTHYGKAIGEKIVEGDEEIPDALPASFHIVDRLWVDNAWDTQRRRGLKPTYRKTYNDT